MHKLGILTSWELVEGAIVIYYCDVYMCYSPVQVPLLPNKADMNE